MIVINARFLTQELRGVQRFAEQICLELKRQRDDLVFVAPHDIQSHDSADALGVQRIGVNSGHVWEQVDLPLWLMRHGNPLLLSLTNTGPLAYGNQISTLHDVTYIRHPESYSRRFGLAYRLLMPALLRRVRGVVTVSEFSRREIAETYTYPPDNIFVVPNAVTAHFTAASPAINPGGKRYLLAVSSLNAHKNFRRAVDAFQRLRDVEDVELRIVGSAHKSFADADRLGGSDPRIRLLGRLSESELLEQYRGAEAFVFPSLYEGFGIPPLEAQACGCPVIASNAAAIPEVLGESAIYFDPLDTGQIAASMRRILTEPALRKTLRKRGLANVTRFSWPESAQKISRLLTAALSRRREDDSRLALPLKEH